MLRAAQTMLETGQIPGDLRAAVYRALTRVRGVRITENQRDLDGRVGTMIGVTGSGQAFNLIVDQKTGDYFGARTVQDSPAGQLVEANAVTTGVANAIGVPPTR
ncbi:hypothetical protein GCM10029964_120010 [Kibdelosporangium lantanae]